MAEEAPPPYNQQQPYYQEQPQYQQQPQQQQPVIIVQQQPPPQQQQPIYVDQYGNPIQPQQPQQPVYAQPVQQQPMQQQQQQQPIQQYDQNATQVVPPTTDGSQPAPMDGFGTSEYGERMEYSQPEYKDKIWAIIWLVHLAAMIIVLCLVISHHLSFVIHFLFEYIFTKNLYKVGSFGSKTVGSSSSSSGYVIVFVCGAMGVVLGYIWTLILRRFAGIIIKFMMWANLVFLIISTIITFGAGLVFNGIILLLSFSFILSLHSMKLNITTRNKMNLIFRIITIFFGLYMWRVWHRIPFAEVLIMISSDIIKAYPGIIWTALLMLAAQIVWILIWGGTVTILLASDDVGTSYFVYFILLISLYWNLETFKNLCHCTVCGVAASWYFSPYPQSPTKAALKRSCTTSLGSVALGSLIVSIIQATRAIIRQAARDGHCNQFLACCIDCLLGCLERWIEWFNKYAYAHVAIYGEAFIPSAKQTWSLLSSKGIDAWINDDLTGFALICGSVIGGFICAAIAGLMVTVNDNLDNDLSTAYAFLGFFVGFYLCWTVLNTVASCVVAIFVSFAEDPQAMEINRTNEYNKLIAARSGISGADYDKQQKEMEQQQQQQQQQQPPPQPQQGGQQQYGNMYNNY